jgi:hypothetical protein
MNDKITCPKCSHEFDVEEAISKKLEAHLRADFDKKLETQQLKFQEERKALDNLKEQLEKEKEIQAQLIEKELKSKLQQEKAKIEAATLESYKEKMQLLEEENEKRRAENKTLREKEVALLKKEKAIQEQQEEMALTIEKELLERQKDIEEKAKARERESFELEKQKLLKQIEDNKKLAEEMKRKAESGSMQLQGEIQELALEKLLQQTYPFDSIEEVPKGIRGADCIQKVVNKMQQVCGSIVYESKRTKSFSNDWIEKLKQDQIACKADVAVIVTETMPADMLRFGERDGVWICSFHEVKSVSFVLREMLLKLQSVRQTQENKGDKMEMLYSYLTSPEFVQSTRRVIENYDNMRQQLDKEKRAMTKLWAEREKQIWAVQENLAIVFGSIKGIAGTAIDDGNILELDNGEEEDL